MRDLLIKNGKIQYIKISLLTVLLSIVFARLSLFLEIQELILNHIDSIFVSLSTILVFVQIILTIISQLIITIDYVFNVRYVKKTFLINHTIDSYRRIHRVFLTTTFDFFIMVMRC